MVLKRVGYDGAATIAPAPRVPASVEDQHFAIVPAIVHGDACIWLAFQQIFAAKIVAVDAATRAMRGLFEARTTPPVRLLQADWCEGNKCRAQTLLAPMACVRHRVGAVNVTASSLCRKGTATVKVAASDVAETMSIGVTLVAQTPGVQLVRSRLSQSTMTWALSPLPRRLGQSAR